MLDCGSGLEESDNLSRQLHVNRDPNRRVGLWCWVTVSKGSPTESSPVVIMSRGAFSASDMDRGLRETSGEISQPDRSQAKTRRLVLRVTAYAHNQYRKYFQLVHISI